MAIRPNRFSQCQSMLHIEHWPTIKKVTLFHLAQQCCTTSDMPNGSSIMNTPSVLHDTTDYAYINIAMYIVGGVLTATQDWYTVTHLVRL